jgi:hypothetical protein
MMMDLPDPTLADSAEPSEPSRARSTAGWLCIRTGASLIPRTSDDRPCIPDGQWRPRPHL